MVGKPGTMRPANFLNICVNVICIGRRAAGGQ